jgi:hypothetical protein
MDKAAAGSDGVTRPSGSGAPGIAAGIDHDGRQQWRPVSEAPQVSMLVCSLLVSMSTSHVHQWHDLAEDVHLGMTRLNRPTASWRS